MTKKKHSVTTENGEFDSGKSLLSYRTIGSQKDLATTHPIIAVAACSETNNILDQIQAKVGISSVVVNYRGRGGSEAVNLKDHSIPAYAQDILSTYAKFNVKSSSILGYSHNSEVAVHLAINEPRRVRSLILVEPALFVDREVFEKRIRLFESGNVDEALRETFSYASPTMTDCELKEAVKTAKEYYGSDYSGLLGEYKARAEYNLSEEALCQIQVPTLIIGGTRSNVRTQVARAARSIPNASVFWAHGANHYLEGYADSIASVIESFRALNKDAM